MNRSYLFLLMVVYDLVYLTILLVALPYLLFKIATSPKHRAGLVERLGRLPEWPDRGPRIWIHGVSVGEVLAAKSLVAGLERELPNHEIVISTTTKTGQEVARKHYPGKRVFYYPLDLSWATRKVLRRVNPQAVILLELEIWPNFLLATSVTEVPVLLVNGRISRKSFRRYGVLQRVIPEPMDRILLYCVQTRIYAERFRKLGVAEDRLKITGTMKFDNIATDRVQERIREVREALAIEEGEKVLMAGSTHPTEEETLYGVYTRLRSEDPSWRFIVVPRHPERFPEVEAMLRRRGARVLRKTAFTPEAMRSDRPVLLVDTMGELAAMYAAADLVFVGGSLIPHGGQNMMDPAGIGRPVLFGPHVRNFRESVDILLDSRAAVMAKDAAVLEDRILTLARRPEVARDMGERARRVVIDQKGASRRILDLILPYFGGDARGAPGGKSSARAGAQ